MRLFSPFIKKKKDTQSFYDNANRIARIVYRFNPYYHILKSFIRKRVRTKDIIGTQFPFLMPDLRKPPIVALELTNVCNLKCPYCTSPLGLRPRGYMSEETFARFERDLIDADISRVTMVGNGESTIHPQFIPYIHRLSKAVRYLSIVTNGQWIRPGIAEALLNTVDLVEISVDPGGKEMYEQSRPNASYEKLIANLTELKALKKKLGSKTLINIRLMIKAGDTDRIPEYKAFWKQFCDFTMVQYLIQLKGTKDSDTLNKSIYNNEQSYPRCTFPFKHIEVRWKGDILLCHYSQLQLGQPGLLAGDINNERLLDIWNGPVMSQYRKAHRERDFEKMPACKGCNGY
jgi:MoaA/NifB/PqqE/SkfB family radical SAM enzyme